MGLFVIERNIVNRSSSLAFGVVYAKREFMVRSKPARGRL